MSPPSFLLLSRRSRSTLPLFRPYRCLTLPYHTLPSLAIGATKALVVAALSHNARAAGSVFSAGLSHQLRDATRRGLWMYPPRGPTTPPLGYPVYLAAQALQPLLVALCLGGGVVSTCGSFVGSEVSAVRCVFRASVWSSLLCLFGYFAEVERLVCSIPPRAFLDCLQIRGGREVVHTPSCP